MSRTSQWPLEPPPETLERWTVAAAEALRTAVPGLSSGSASGVVGAEAWARAAELSPPIGEAPLPGGLDDALRIIDQTAALALNTTGPGYLAYVPGGGLYAAALAALLGDGYNRFTGLAAAAPGFARLESDVLVWLAGELGYEATAAGLFTTGGSMANFGAIVTARHHHLGDTGDYRDVAFYTTDQAHRCVGKAARLAGLPTRSHRVVPVDRALRLDPRRLDDAIREDLADGRRPFLVVASAGTTNTGAVDPLDEIGEVCAAHGLWLHVDGAYGGCFALCAEGRARLGGLARADSIAIDPHKGLFLPYGLGALFVRDGARLRAAHAETAAYLQDLADPDPLAVPSPSDYGPELSRDFRGLRLWLPLMLHGAAPFRAAAAEKLALAQRFREALRALSVEVPVEPELSVVAFRAPRRRGEPLAAWNARNQALLDGINRRGRVFLSSTTLPTEDGDALTLRICVLSYKTHAEQIDACVEDLRAALGDPDVAL
ncbi:MAG: aminotransferase class V-fold PLP-dependent enzyme [Deltaproteobacteria bacterium]|nr:MAG: aminotransferase class V-fold PLP-dependent enzyme [Deltaproteobacteria bacterium]